MRNTSKEKEKRNKEFPYKKRRGFIERTVDDFIGEVKKVGREIFADDERIRKEDKQNG